MKKKFNKSILGIFSKFLILALSLMALSYAPKAWACVEGIQESVLNARDIAEQVEELSSNPDAWDRSKVSQAFAKKLQGIFGRLDGLDGLLEELDSDPQSATQGKILAWLKVISGQIQGLEKMVENHLSESADLDLWLSLLADIEAEMEQTLNQLGSC